MGDVKAPAFLLVEGGEHLERKWEGEIEALLDFCEEAGIPRLLWITGRPLKPAWVGLSRRFDRVFSVDRDDLAPLESAGAPGPSPLWEATALPPDGWPPLDAPRPDAVVWLGGWHDDWPGEWQERLTSVLMGAAPHGLTIVAIEDADAFPVSLRKHLFTQDQVDRQAALRQAKVVIGADPARDPPRIAPAVIFDALACGAAVVTPHGFGYNGAFSISAGGHEIRNLIPVVRDTASAGTEIGRLLADDALREDTVRGARQIVAYNHTYSHRVATLASAAGIRIVPDAL